MIRPDADALAQQLHRQMAIAEMPGDPHHLAFVMRMDLQQRLRPRAHPHHAAIHRQSIAIAQPHRLRQVEQHLPALLRPQQDAPAMAAIEVDQHAIDFRRRIPGAGRQDRVGAHQNRK